MSKGEKIDSSITMGFVLAVFAPLVHFFSDGIRWVDFAFGGVILFWIWLVLCDWKRG